MPLWLVYIILKVWLFFVVYFSMKLPELFYYASCTIPIVINSHILYMSKFNNFDSSYRTYISSVYVFAELHPISSFISQVEHVTPIMFYLMLAMFQNDSFIYVLLGK